MNTLNNADYLERGALGINGYRIYEVLCQTETQVTLKEITRRTQLSGDTVRYHLREERPLRQQGLVQIYGARRNRTYSGMPVSHDELNTGLATACGTAGKSAARQKKHQQERGWFMAGLIVRRMERTFHPAIVCHSQLSRQLAIPDARQATAPPV